jgi:hypothetical protein
MAERVPAPRKQESMVRAREIVLSDHAGTPRVRPSALPEGTPVPWMTDGSNTEVRDGDAAPVGEDVHHEKHAAHREDGVRDRLQRD